MQRNKDICYFVNDLPEGGLYGPKHVGLGSLNNIQLFAVTCIVSWIKCGEVTLANVLLLYQKTGPYIIC